MLSKLLYRIALSYNYRLKDKSKSLKNLLISENKLRWLDIGSSIRVSEGFYFTDTYPVSKAPKEMQDRYFQLDIIKACPDDLALLGKFDLIRMQHVFEHFSMEDGLDILDKCHDMLNDEGYLLISVPDLKIYVKNYLKRSLHTMSYREWALRRIPAEAPQSFYFSIFTHSMPYEAHLWCYDEEGLKYQLSRKGKFRNIKRLSLFDPLSEIPFTHNRPDEDLCILAQRA
jgi:predicted SAM-dependent methyltransferase